MLPSVLTWLCCVWVAGRPACSFLVYVRGCFVEAGLSVGKVKGKEDKGWWLPTKKRITGHVHCASHAPRA